jgi:hypothetical protein
MTLFTGIHEVVCKRADGKLYVGYFDDESRVLASVDNDSTYQALWYSLNPLKEVPQGAKLNGTLALKPQQERLDARAQAAADRHRLPARVRKLQRCRKSSRLSSGSSDQGLSAGAWLA